MRYKSLFIIAAASVAAFISGCAGGSSECEESANKVSRINITPAPVEVTPAEGSFVLKRGTAFVASTPEEVRTAEFFAKKLRVSTGFPFKVVSSEKSKSISLKIDGEQGIKPEGYKLTVSPDGVSVIASDEAGLFYGMESFMQLLPAQVESPVKVGGVKWRAQAVSIEDYPRFPHRGTLMDVCRHFRDVEWIKKQLDVYALYKINILHLHLTEDQGWRMEIKKYPKLTEMGSQRVLGEGGSHGGFYTQEQLKDLVAYAAERHITIVPELEIPGHELAAIYAYPELSCRGKAVPVRQIWGVEDIVMCPGKELMFEFLEDVIKEMVEIFPSPVYHIGGDECPKAEWKKCPACQKRIREEGLNRKNNGFTPEQNLQSYVLARMEKCLAKYGKSIIGWDEILEGELSPNAIVMSWRGVEGGIEAVKQGHKAIMTPGSAGYYLDWYQGDPLLEPVEIGGYKTIEDTYEYEPVPESLTDKADLFIGVQGNVWSEYLYTDELAEYMTFPRLIAIAETAWSPSARKGWDDFKSRLDNDVCMRLALHDISFHVPLPEQPSSKPGSGRSINHIAFIDTVSVPFVNTRNLKMVFTLDGSEPTAKSEEYTGPLSFKEGCTVKIRTVLPCGIMSNVRTVVVEKQTLAPAVQIPEEELCKGWVVKTTPGYYLSMDDLNASEHEWKTSVVKNTEEVTEKFGDNNSWNVETPQFAALFSGYVMIPETGIYWFNTNYEELVVDGKTVISNKGEVKRGCRTGASMALEAGLHEVKTAYLGHIIGGWPSAWSGTTLPKFIKWGEELPGTLMTGDCIFHRKADEKVK